MNEVKTTWTTIFLRILFLPFTVPVFFCGFFYEWGKRVFQNGQHTQQVFRATREMKWI